MALTTTRELAFREADGIEVSLLWHACDDRLTVLVADRREGTAFELRAAADKALDVFYHPFAHYCAA